MPYTSADFENSDLWKIYEATTGISTGLEIGVTPITGGNSQGVLFNNVGVLQNTGAFTYNSATNILGVNTISPNGSNHMEIRRASGRSIIFADTGGNGEWYVNNSGQFSEASPNQINVTEIQGGTPYLNLGQGGSIAQRINGSSTRLSGLVFVDNNIQGYGGNELRLSVNSSGKGIKFQNNTGTTDYLNMSNTGDFTLDIGSQFITAGAQFSRSGFVWINELGNDAYIAGHTTSGYGLLVGNGAIPDPSAPGFAPVAFGIVSTTKGFLLPTMTIAQKTAISGVAGLMVFDTTAGRPSFHDGTTWTNL